MSDSEPEVRKIEKGEAWQKADEEVEVDVKRPLDKVVPVRLPADAWEELRREARERGVGPSALAKEWILEKLAERKRRRESQEKQREFARRVARAAKEAGGPEPTEEEIVEAVKATREEMYRERHGGTPESDLAGNSGLC
ncbi:MAG: hypothetical protein ABSG55_04390 [Dehalococcoidia bacterium]|jgi:hypothetical protein